MSRKLRSQHWFGGLDKDAFIHRSWMKNNGLPDDAFDGRPVIGICNTFSEFTPCNAHFRGLIEHIKAGVLEAGGLPLCLATAGVMAAASWISARRLRQT